ncbi:MAG TPA: HlyD family efflux transporter periplasmic adaptor subunit [bacterium]|nr:HlyD family efflux transporter periplasmic adaptor subunit [bacterium]
MKRRKKIIIFSLTFVVILGLVLFFVFKKDKVEYSTTELKKQDLKQTVSEIGTVKASQEVGLNFSQVGKLKEVYFKVGDQVAEGDVLAELDYSSLLIRKEEALAAVSISKTNQDKLIKGAYYEDIAVLEAQVKQAEGSYKSAQDDLIQTKKLVSESIYQAEKSLNDLKSPNSQTPMAIKQAVESAEINLSNTERTSRQSMENSRDSLLSSLDYNFSVSRSALDADKRILDDENIKNVFSVKNYYYKVLAERFYDDSINTLPQIEAYIRIAKENPSQENIKKASDELISFLGKTFDTLNNCFSALENTIVSSTFTQTSLDAFKASINTNKGYVNSSILVIQNSYFSFSNSTLNYSTSVSGAEDNLNRARVALSDAVSSAENNLSLVRINSDQQIISAEARVDSTKKSYEVAKLQLIKLKTPAKSDDLKLAQSQVDQALASLSLIEKQIEENKIKAPINGKITKINYEIGEQISGVNPVINLLTENNFEIEVYISESDISKIKIDNEALVNFDAFGDEYKVSGRVYFVEPAATSISDVIYYKIKINFSEDELGKNGFVIKSGMTANVDIITNYKKDVLVLSSRTVLLKNGGDRYVRVLDGKDVKEVPVKVGISGDQAMVEIISEDLKEGDIIVTAIKNGK